MKSMRSFSTGFSCKLLLHQTPTFDTEVGSKARDSSETVSGDMAVGAPRVRGV